MSGSVAASHALAAADRFRGEETANLGRAGIALGLLATGHEYGALALATFVLVMAVLLRSGHAGLWISVVTIAVDTEVLVFFEHAPPLPLMVACASLAVALASLRADWRLVLAAGALAWLGLRAHVLQRTILGHGVDRALHLSTEQLRWFAVPAALALVLALAIAWSRRRRLVAHAKRASGSLPIDEQAGYRDPAAGGTSGLGVCETCHAPLIATKSDCWLCGERAAGVTPIDASRVVARIFDPRVGRRAAIAAVGLATTTMVLVFALVSSVEGRPLILVTPALFVLVTLVPLIAHVRSPEGRRGEMLTATGLARPIGLMLAVVLGVSGLVLALTSLGVIVAAVCTAQGFPMR